MSNMHYNWWETGQLLEAIVNPPLEVLDFGYGQIYKTSFGNKQHAVCSYNQKLHSLHLLEFFYNDFKFVGLVKVVGALQTHLLCIAPCYIL